MGRERLYRQLKAHLIVALAGCAVADRRGAFLFGYLDEALGYHGPGKAGAQQVFALVHRAHLQRGPDAVGHELLAHVLYVYLASAGLYRLFVQRREFLALTHVHRHRDDFAIVVFLEPRYYYRRIQTARIREHDLFLSHCDIPPVICLRAPYGVACPSAHKEYTTTCIKIQYLWCKLYVYFWTGAEIYRKATWRLGLRGVGSLTWRAAGLYYYSMRIWAGIGI